MIARHKLRIAHILMMVGISPWVFALAWTAAILLSIRSGQAPAIFMLDPFAMIGVLMVTFAIGVVVAGLSGLWSASLTANNPELISRKVVVFRVTVAAALCAPPLLAIGLESIG